MFAGKGQRTRYPGHDGKRHGNDKKHPRAGPAHRSAIGLVAPDVARAASPFLFLFLIFVGGDGLCRRHLGCICFCILGSTLLLTNRIGHTLRTLNLGYRGFAHLGIRPVLRRRPIGMHRQDEVGLGQCEVVYL